MADEKDKSKAASGSTSATDADQLGENGKKALTSEREARKIAEAEAADLKRRLQEIEDKDKSDAQKATDRAAAAERERDAAQGELLRVKIARKHGLDDEDMGFVHGTTEAEIEGSAAKLAARIGTKAAAGDGDAKDGKDAGNGDGKGGDGKGSGAPAGRPTANLSGGGDPTVTPEVTDPAKLAASIPRI